MGASHKLKHLLYSCIYFLKIVFEFSSQEDEIHVFNLPKQFNPQDLNRVIPYFKKIKRKN